MQRLDVEYTAMVQLFGLAPLLYVPRGKEYALYMVTDDMFLSSYIATPAQVADFDANYKAGSTQAAGADDALLTGWRLNRVGVLVEVRGPDGRPNIRPAVASAGKVFNLRSFTFYTANDGSLVNEKWDGTPWGDVAYRMYDANGVETNNGVLAVRTELDYEAQYEQELIGGWLNQDPSIAGLTAGWWFASVGAPDIPPAFGGQIDFVSKTSLEVLQQNRLDMDGRSTMPTPYDPDTHAGLIRFIFWHPQGIQKRFQITLETYK